MENCSVLVLVNLLFFFVSVSLVSLLNKGKLDTFSLGEGNGWGLSVTNNLDESDTGGEDVALDILNVGDLEGSWMLLNGLKDSNSTNVVSSGKHNSSTVVELDNSLDLAGSEVKL